MMENLIVATALALQTEDGGLNSNSTAAGFIVIAMIAIVLGVMAFLFVRTSSRRSPRQ